MRLQMLQTYLIFGDIEGKLDLLRVECTKCDRKGRYHVHKLIEKYGRNGNVEVEGTPTVPNATADCMTAAT
jgi:hypothetical protein